MKIVAEIAPQPKKYRIRCLDHTCFRNIITDSLAHQSGGTYFVDLPSAEATARVHANDYQHRVVVEVEE
jgi:hypothetical protein